MVTEFLIAAGLMWAIATAQQPATRVILLPNADGHASTLTLSTGADVVILDKPYQLVDVRRDLSAHVQQLDAQAVQNFYPNLLNITPKAEEKFLLYFQTGGTELTAESEQTLQTVLAKARERRGGELVIIGHTDAQGDAAQNDALSLKRAQRLRDAIAATGFSAERIQAYGRGERDLLVPTEDGVADARNRRAQIIVR